jgi:hypothetical protein
MKWASYVARIGEMRNARNILVVENEVIRPLGRHRCKRENNIRLDPREIGWEVVGVDWMHLAQDRDQ